MLPLSYLKRIFTISNGKKELNQKTVSRELREQSILGLIEYIVCQFLELLVNRDEEICRLRRLVYQDPLTKLLNWRGLLEQIVILDLASEVPFYAPHMMYLYLEGARGDNALCMTAKILQERFQSNTDVVARVGEYEFLIFLSDTRMVNIVQEGRAFSSQVKDLDTVERRIVPKVGIAEVVIPKNTSRDTIDTLCKEFLNQVRKTSRELR